MSKLSPILAHFSLQRVLAGLVLVPLLAYSFAPFHDMDLSFPVRLIFWAGVIALALMTTWVAGYLVRLRVSESAVYLRDGVFALLILCQFAPALWVLTWLVFTFNGTSAPGLMTVMPYGVMLAMGLMLVRQRDVTQPEEEIPQLPRLYRRLPPGFEGQIYRLTVRDHSVDVVTSDGVFTIRSRFTDAIDEMDPVPGHCTHRSHWVTEAAILGVEKQDGKTFLKLCNDDFVPVSRKYRPGLEQAGLV
ncbi:LytTR family DNA-binding domain-containing protein [Ruegeria sp.]|uniref:LytTR family DNA-binding domain-containing protein n=1 Tax=Ruegeria sp. TaxID=1879320 RepID=UPI00230EA71F|nr:LytTR family DNA-binding domain-containing protein [Ruegeria sp.]MDA7965896.1 LytTR family transcriptional regulator [Ruegeria sp.]